MESNVINNAQPLNPAPDLPLRVVLVAKAAGSMTGVGRYVQSLSAELQRSNLLLTTLGPALPPLPQAGYRALARLRIDLAAFLTTYPIWARYPPADVYHFSSQNLASLLLFRRPPGKIVVTVHDIIPHLLRNQPTLSTYQTWAERLFDRLAMAGLKRADLLVADSAYTRQTIIEQLGIAADKIRVVYLGIDQQRYRPLPASPELFQRYGLNPASRYLIYVGSEDPRKNLRALLAAVAEVRQHCPNIELIKVGRAHYVAERQHLLLLAQRLGIQQAIHFLDDVPEADLPGLYNLAELGVMPARYEGFGFPLLEALACGTPVVYCAASSLPELAGSAGIGVAPSGNLGANLAAGICALLTDPAAYQRASVVGLEQAATFQWSTTSAQMQAIYAALLGRGAGDE